MKYLADLTRVLGREPSAVERHAFEVAWSEHCGYSHTKAYISRLPGVSREVNAGVVELGDGLVCVFKIESHNHPSAVEPYNGAATGVGGIIRDVLAMGVRPVALMDSLHMHKVIDGIVAGIGDYGNAIGVPTVGGQLHISSRFKHNPLVNAMALGIGRSYEVVPSRANSPDQVIVVFGGLTGRDGIHGASFASRDLSGEHERINIQVGDPFAEKLLIEAFLRMRSEGLVDGAQDLGAGGVLMATCELMGKGGLGGTVYLDAVPLREPDMEGWEILLSESQERMAVVTTPDRAERVLEIAREHMLYGALVARLDRSGVYRAVFGGEVLLEVPVRALLEAPTEPALEVSPPPLSSLRSSFGFEEESALPVFSRYDYMVGNDTVLPPGLGPAVMRVKGFRRGVAICVHSREDLAESSPYWASFVAVFEACRKLVSVGARPVGITDGLNFGDPDVDPLGLALTMRGLEDACRRLGLPVVSGNASLYNTFEGTPIPPTLIVGAVGAVEDVHRVLRRPPRGKVFRVGFEGFDPSREKDLWRGMELLREKGCFVLAQSSFPNATLVDVLSSMGLSLRVLRRVPRGFDQAFLVVSPDGDLGGLGLPFEEVGEIS